MTEYIAILLWAAHVKWSVAHNIAWDDMQHTACEELYGYAMGW